MQLQAGPAEGPEHDVGVPVSGVDRAAHLLLHPVGDPLSGGNERRALPKTLDCL